MFVDNPGQSLKTNVIRKQALSLNIPSLITKTSWHNYESNFISSIKKILHPSISTCVFGDINIVPDSHDLWHEKVCQKLFVNNPAPRAQGV